MPDPIAALIAELVEAEAAEQARAARIRDSFENRVGHPRPVALVGEDAQVWRALEAADPPDRRAADGLCGRTIDAYLEADADGRAALRAACAGKRYLTWRLGWLTGGYVTAIESGTSADVAGVCRRALAGVSLGGARPDVRDAIVVLDRLYLACLHAGLDPAPLVAEAHGAALDASEEPTDASRLLAMYLAPERVDAFRRSVGRRRDA